MGESDKALEFLRIELIKEYPGDTPAFGKAAVAPEETEFFYRDLVLPAFGKIKEAFDDFHFVIAIRRHRHVARLDVKDGCSLFSCSIRVTRYHACAVLLISYRDESICSYNFEEKVLVEERFDLSKIYQTLPEDLIIAIFSDTFINRRAFLQRIVDNEKSEQREKDALRREQRRAKFIKLKLSNERFDPEDEYRKYLDNLEHENLSEWVDLSVFFEDEEETPDEQPS